ncbi:GrpE-domain-containing protein [Pisolithus orientalis]|uniref:GrpE-domain-containing protein n=1 Tax=Pisolithus orientalis TaxID=936130 RepID=UPI002225B102|nr:GrpE-domain-containing protein [Pisolithus orientalis]KAI6028403.1 GrpE-domain-containing protein [Pisolithus orientalis]
MHGVGLARRSLLSFRSLARPSRQVLGHPLRCLPPGIRHLSDDKLSESQPVQDAQPQPDTDIPPQTVPLEQLKAKEAEVVDLTNRLRYLQADFVNLQRNAAREKEQQRDYAISRFAGDLLEVVDVLSLALKSVPTPHLNSPSSPPPNPSDPPTSPQKSAQDYLVELHHGVQMTHRLLLSVLGTYGVKSFDPTGEKFDPNRHEALYQAPIPEKEPGTVIDCQKIGFMIKDRLLRAAQVGVAQDTS